MDPKMATLKKVVALSGIADRPLVMISDTSLSAPIYGDDNGINNLFCV
jgi:hypothetical protein